MCAPQDKQRPPQRQEAMGCGGMLRSRNSSPTVRDYRTGTGEEGRFQFELKVYGRRGEPCVTCGKKLVTTHTIDLRATTFCPRCQG